jgi:hypothetical protein
VIPQKRAAGCGPTAGQHEAGSSYRPNRQCVNVRPPIFPGHQDRRPALPPAAGASLIYSVDSSLNPAHTGRPAARPSRSADAATVGLFLLLLSIGGSSLAPSRARAAWTICERWAREYVAAKRHAEGRG